MNNEFLQAVFSGEVMALDEIAAGPMIAEANLLANNAAASGGIDAVGGDDPQMMGGVAVVGVQGVLMARPNIWSRIMGWASYAGLSDTLGELTARDDVSAIVLDINSPGGAVMGLDDAVAAVKAAAAVKPVYAIASPMAASAGYWLAVHATEIIADRGASVGSIGTLMQRVEPIGAGSDGVQRVVMKSSNARAKASSVGTPDDRGLAQIGLDRAEARFLDDVAEGRGIARDDLTRRLALTDDTTTGGELFDADDAQARGLVDRIVPRAEFMMSLAAQYPAPVGAPQMRRRGSSAQALAQAAQAIAEI